MQENFEEFISSTLRTRNSRRPSRMLARNWKHQWLPLCLARSARTIRIVGMVINPIKSNQNLRVFWKPVQLQGSVWENLYREKTTPQKTRFRSVNNYKELQDIHIQVKSEYVGTVTTTELMTQSRTTNTTTCLTWTQTWSTCTLTRTTPETRECFFCLFVCSVSLVSSSFDSLHITLWLKIHVCASFIMSHAHVDWLSLSSTSTSTSLSFSSSS